MDKYVLHSKFYAIDIDDVDVVLGYPWMHSIGTVNINVHNIFLKLWYKKKKIALQDISFSNQEEPKLAHEVSTRKKKLHLLTHHMKSPWLNQKKILLKNMNKFPRKSMEMKKILLKHMKKCPRKSIKMKKNLSNFLP